MIKTHEFDPVVYPRKLWVAITDREDDINGLFNVECDVSMLSESRAICFPCSRKETDELGVAVIFSKKEYMTIGDMAHESVHVASNIFNDLGMTMGFNDGKDEHFAYLAGWAAECIGKAKANTLE